MSELIIKKFPDPLLRKKAEKVEKVSSREKEILAQMADAMYLSQGVGLAATQVGVNKQMVVIDVGGGLIKLINPVIIKKQGREISEEGCLSVPGVCVKVKRPKCVTVSFVDEYGDVRKLTAEGLLARAVQHELDHLAGVLIIDYINPIKKMMLKGRINKKKEIVD